MMLNLKDLKTQLNRQWIKIKPSAGGSIENETLCCTQHDWC